MLLGFSTCFFQAEDGRRELVRSRGLGDVYKRQRQNSINKAANRQTRGYYLPQSHDKMWFSCRRVTHEPPSRRCRLGVDNGGAFTGGGWGGFGFLFTFDAASARHCGNFGGCPTTR